jgi:prevent-host-death family protein
MREPMTQTVKASQARQEWSQLLEKVSRGEARVLVEKSGVPVTAIVSIEDFRRLKQYERQRAERFKIRDEIGAAFRVVPEEELEREVAKAEAAAREELRREKQEAPSAS